MNALNKQVIDIVNETDLYLFIEALTPKYSNRKVSGFSLFNPVSNHIKRSANYRNIYSIYVC